MCSCVNKSISKKYIMWLDKITQRAFLNDIGIIDAIRITSCIIVAKPERLPLTTAR
ncbi:hypothetical protein B194_2708 [Serratia plymuthica A30]|nr:hypothetical protein B194_2708 [Serratia plymuthica A30]